jgi:hypothetical protein
VSWISDNAELVLGLAGILGALVGALIGARVGLQVERRRQEFERDENDRRERLRMMQAARILDSELMTAETTIDYFVMQKNTLWPDELAYPDGAVWPELRGVVATALDPAGWITLNTGFLALRDARIFKEGYRKLGHDDTWDLPPSTKALFEPPLASVRRAREALHPLAYPDHVRLPEGHPLRALDEATKEEAEPSGRGGHAGPGGEPNA